MDFVTIDFEASCLPCHGRSYPIEIGISGREGTRSWLIRPQAAWRTWDWTGEAAQLHGITHEMLEREGETPDRVFAAMTRAIDGRRVVADSMVDALWWRTLAEAARQPVGDPPEHAGQLLDEWHATADEISEARRHADRLCPERHRAGADARWLWILLSSLKRNTNASAIRRAA